jgi:hypothetical protein
MLGQLGHRRRDALRHQALRGVQQDLAHARARPVRRFAAGGGLAAGGRDQARRGGGRLARGVRGLT